jgi:hypothetical protein
MQAMAHFVGALAKDTLQKEKTEKTDKNKKGRIAATLSRFNKLNS